MATIFPASRRKRCSTKTPVQQIGHLRRPCQLAAEAVEVECPRPACDAGNFAKSHTDRYNNRSKGQLLFHCHCDYPLHYESNMAAARHLLRATTRWLSKAITTSRRIRLTARISTKARRTQLVRGKAKQVIITLS